MQPIKGKYNTNFPLSFSDCFCYRMKTVKKGKFLLVAVSRYGTITTLISKNEYL